jgi:hypothetical protein
MGTDDRAMALVAEIGAAAAILAYRRRERFASWLSGVRDTIAYLSPFLRDYQMREFKRPVELIGFRSRLERARSLEQRIGKTGGKYDEILNAIQQKVEASEAHLSHLEEYDKQLAQVIEQMVGESNGPPTSDESGSPG